MPNHYAEQEEEIRKEQEEHRKKIMKNEMKNKVGVEIELPERDILKLALIAHEKDITLNDLIHDVVQQGIKDGEHRFEHDKRPELLNEQNDHF